MPTKLQMSLAAWGYDRVRALADGRVRPDGIELTMLDLPPEETFFRMLRHREFDAAELSLSSYTLSLFADDPAFIAIPVFLSRSFRHSGIYVHARSGIESPADLVGKRVGVPEYQMTAAVWIRGMLAEHHGVPVESVEYLTGGEEETGRHEKLALDLPPSIRLSPIGADDTLTRLLDSGRIDAVYAARAPSAFEAGSPNIRRLFQDHAAEEAAYFSATGIFPIMHVVAIQRAVYERHPWVAQSLLKAFTEAKQLAYDELTHTVALRATLPWLPSHMEQTRALMGTDYWPYGLAANRHTVQTFLRYSHGQHLARSLLEPEALFAAETSESYKI